MKSIKRRRQENKTDYQKRMRILKGNLPRVVFRKTNRHIISEYVVSDETKDRAEIGVTSKNLLKYGWPEKFKGSLKSIPASYLTGFLIGKKIIKGKKETPIVDLGMTRNIHKSKAFAFLNGLVDAGLKIKHDKKTFPEEDRIKGKNLKEDFSKTFESIKSKVEKE
ncbi:50S ribosomal protein L18 [Candidatus Pacearchaeota archaeon]|nr:50S ribosomal protein L18 [Candidatus Pacearchaeota archaeon]